MITGTPDRHLDRRFDQFFAPSGPAPLGRGEPLLVALSGGPDSTALLTALVRWGGRRQVPIRAAHLDHAQDPGSAERARRAAGIARALGVSCTVERRPVGTDVEASAPGGWEAAARRARYAFLEEVRRRTGAGYTVTAHHLEDQAETVALRLLAGSGLRGLAAIRPVAEPTPGTRRRQDPDADDRPTALARVVRPLLDVPAARLHAAIGASEAELTPVRDPSNDDLARRRNLVRHRLLPALRRTEPALPSRLAGLAAAARGAHRAIDRALDAKLVPRTVDRGAAVDLAALRGLPSALLPAALSLLHRVAGARYPAPAAARQELAAQLADAEEDGRSAREIGCDAGDGWRWQSRGRDLRLVTVQRTPAAPFTYTLEVPGTLEIPELSLRFRLHPARFEAWMLRGEPRRAGLALPLAPGDVVRVRSRRPGDRLQPLGAPGRRRLKELLIDRRVPRRERDRLPLLCLGGNSERIAWVPGVTVDEAFRLARHPRGAASVWLAEIEPCQETDTR